MDMDKEERTRILTSSKLLKAREDSPEPWVDPYSDMSSDEKSKLLCELMAMHLRDEKRNEELMAKLDGLAFLTLAAISMLVIQSDNLFQRSYLFKQIP